MTIIPSSQANKVQASPTTTIWEFPINEQAISGAVAQIEGRYPKNGFAVNKVSKELAFVISGEGNVVTPTLNRAIEVGDLIFLDHEESFAWEGDLTLFMATTPKFDPKQHVVVHSSK